MSQFVAHPMPLGVVSLDREHERMCRLVLDLDRVIRQSHPPDAMDGVLSLLLVVTRRHLVDEDLLMVQYNYPREQPHKAEHAEFLERIQGLIKRNRVGTLEASAAQDLGQHLTHHIATFDRDLADHVRAQGGHPA